MLSTFARPNPGGIAAFKDESDIQAIRLEDEDPKLSRTPATINEMLVFETVTCDVLLVTETRILQEPIASVDSKIFDNSFFSCEGA